MGLIIKNGIKYFGDNTVQLTQAQYDALSQAEKLNGTTYYITDGQNITTASAVTYDNTSSGLNATDVNAAIDEVNAKTGSDIAISSSDSKSIAEAIAPFKSLKTYEHSSYLTVNASNIATFNITVPKSDYRLVVGIGITSNESVLPMQYYLSTATNLHLRVRNLSSQAQQFSFFVNYI